MPTPVSRRVQLWNLLVTLMLWLLIIMLWRVVYSGYLKMHQPWGNDWRKRNHFELLVSRYVYRLARWDLCLNPLSPVYQQGNTGFVIADKNKNFAAPGSSCVDGAQMTALGVYAAKNVSPFLIFRAVKVIWSWLVCCHSALAIAKPLLLRAVAQTETGKGFPTMGNGSRHYVSSTPITQKSVFRE